MTHLATRLRRKMEDTPAQHEKEVATAFDKINECLDGRYTGDAHRQAFLQFVLMTTGIPIHHLPLYRTGHDEYEAMHRQADEIKSSIMGEWSHRLWPRRNHSFDNTERLGYWLKTYILNLLQCEYSVAPALQDLLNVAAKGDSSTATNTQDDSLEKDINTTSKAMEKSTLKQRGFLDPEELREEDDDERYDGNTRQFDEQDKAAIQADGFEVVEHDNQYLAAKSTFETKRHICDCSVDIVDRIQIECGEEFESIEDLQGHREKAHGVEEEVEDRTAQEKECGDVDESEWQQAG